MWETFQSTPLGRLSMRKYLRFATAFLAACFVYTFISAPLAHAADAEFDGNTLTYSGQQYSGPFTATGSKPSGIPKDSSYYTSVNTTDSKKGSIIYFSADADPKKATNAQLTTGDYDVQSGIFSNLSPPKQISVGTVESSSTEAESSCKIDGVGWLVCNMSKWIADGVDYLYEILTNFFIFEPLTTSTSTSSIYKLWDIVRNFANVAFVIGFLIIIYSQMMNNFMSNYTVKKLLPRIIVAAILVNTSYWICAVGIDLSNILGIAVQDLFTNLRASLGAASNADLPSWNAVTVGILSGSGIVAGGALLVATGGTIGGLAFLLLGALIPAIFAALVAVAILAARQALITLLIILAPLAFVAYLLPNTEEWFNRWRKLFMTLLIMFPAFSLIFGGSQIAGNIIIQNAGGDISVALLGLTVQVVPLFITPFLIKLSSGLMGTIAGLANDRSKGVFDRAKNWTNSSREQHRQRGFSTQQQQGFNRARPTNMARALNNRSLRREGLTSAHKAVAQARFDQTRGGQQVFNRQKNAELYKHAGEASNLEAYNNALYGTPGVAGSGSAYRKQLHHDSITASGRAKLNEDTAAAHAERDLQTQIADPTGPLRQLKIQMDVDTAHAEFQKANITAEGKATFKRQFEDGAIGGRALRLMNVQTSGFEKEAAAIESMLSKRADADWERQSSTDERVQHLRLKEVQAADSYTRAEKEWQRTITEIQTKGITAPGILAPANLEIRAMANSIQADTRATLIQEQAIESAKIVQKSDFASALKESATLRTQAGGIGGEDGATRVYAKAKSEMAAAYMENVKNSRSVLSDYSIKELVELQQNGMDRDKNNVKDNTALRDAALQEILLTKGNNWAFQKTKDAVSQQGMVYDEDDNKYYEAVRDTDGNVMMGANNQPIRGVQITDQKDIDRRRDLQQIFVDSVNQSKLKIASISGTDRGNMETGTFVMSGQDAILRDINDQKINANRLATTDIDELMRMVQVLRDDGARNSLDDGSRQALAETIEFALTDPQVAANIDARAKEMLGVTHSYLTDLDTSISLTEKTFYESRARTKIPSKYKPNRLNDYPDGTGPV